MSLLNELMFHSIHGVTAECLVACGDRDFLGWCHDVRRKMDARGWPFVTPLKPKLLRVPSDVPMEVFASLAGFTLSAIVLGDGRMENHPRPAQVECTMVNSSTGARMVALTLKEAPNVQNSN